MVAHIGLYVVFKGTERQASSGSTKFEGIHRSWMRGCFNPLWVFARILAILLKRQLHWKPPTGIEVGDYHLKPAVQEAWFSCWCDYRLGADKSEHRPNHHQSPCVWTRMIDNPQSAHVTADRWEFIEFEYNVVKAKMSTIFSCYQMLRKWRQRGRSRTAVLSVLEHRFHQPFEVHVFRPFYGCHRNRGWTDVWDVKQNATSD